MSGVKPADRTRETGRIAGMGDRPPARRWCGQARLETGGLSRQWIERDSRAVTCPRAPRELADQ